MKFLQYILIFTFILLFHLKLFAQDEYHLSTIQQEMVVKVLEDHKGWRVARTKDCISSSLSDYQNETPGYLPYFISADFNKDGFGDFMIGFIHNNKLSVMYFLGQRNGYSSPQLLLSTEYYNDCGLSLQENRLLYGNFYTDNAVSYIWNTSKNKYEEEKYYNEDY